MDTNLNIRTDSEVKVAAEKLFSELGLTLSSAVNIFLRQAIRENAIPFEIRLHVPNEVTMAAIEEGERLAHDENAPRYQSMEDLKAALEL